RAGEVNVAAAARPKQKLQQAFRVEKVPRCPRVIRREYSRVKSRNRTIRPLQRDPDLGSVLARSLAKGAISKDRRTKLPIQHRRTTRTHERQPAMHVHLI